MVDLLVKLLEIVGSFGGRVLDRRGVARDAKVAAELVAIVVALQEMCLRAGRILDLAESFLAGTHRPDDLALFAELLRQQSDAVDELRAAVDAAGPLLATVDVEFAFGLTPFLDGKSGLLTRWQQQLAQSRWSTLTLFFLPAASLDRAVEAARPDDTGTHLDAERTDLVLVVADELRVARRSEVRDLRNPGDAQRPQVAADIRTARAAQAHARDLCTGLLDAVRQAVGDEAMSELRQSLVRRQRR